MRVMLLCSSFNGLSQRVWLDLRAAGHQVTVRLGGDWDEVRATVRGSDPEIIICPYLRERVPSDIWTRRRTIIIHPGPVGDRGASSLDWAVTDGAATWGVTAVQAAEEFDAGPVWARRTFPIGPAARRKSSLYNGPVSDAAVQLVREVVASASDPNFVPRSLGDGALPAPGRLRPTMRQADRAFSWSDPTKHIVRRIRAADGSPGVRTTLCGQAVSVFDAHPGPPLPGIEPGTVAAVRHGGVLVRTGDGSVWIGQLRRIGAAEVPAIKLPATIALHDRLAGVPHLLRAAVDEPGRAGFREVRYRRHGPVGILSYDVYNGAMSTADCRRLETAVRYAAARDTRVLVIAGGETFSNGIHLNVIEAATHPAAEAWRNINAIDDVCREIITCTAQLVVTAVGGNAGAGGVMLALAADRVLLRDGVVLNPHYRTMGLYGSEYWTYLLPGRVGQQEAQRLTAECLPIGAQQAARIGLADKVLAEEVLAEEVPAEEVPADDVLPGSRKVFADAVREYAASLAERVDYQDLLQAKRARRADDEHTRPLDSYRAEELGEMSRDIFHDRHDFVAARHAFVTKRPPASDTAPGQPRRRDTDTATATQGPSMYGARTEIRRTFL
jgi:putative two-component system hydrogenase maturation factor HypX/HoxX